MATRARSSAARKSAAGRAAARKSPARKTGARAPARAGRAPERAAPVARAARAGTPGETIAHLQQVQADLEVVALKLVAIDPDQLDAEARREWEKKIDRVDLALTRARNAVLRGLVEAFEEEAPAIRAATSALARSLERLNRAAQIIEAVAAVLGVFERIITLGR